MTQENVQKDVKMIIIVKKRITVGLEQTNACLDVDQISAVGRKNIVTSKMDYVSLDVITK
jgi:hypothetical protein